MNQHLRVHVGRRRQAIVRLQSLTTGAVVAGVAGTIGFGVLAAATFSGKSSAQAATTDNTPSATGQAQAGSGASPQTSSGSDTSRNRGSANAAIPTPGTLGAAPTPRPTRTPRPHAATGGSG
jgi:hypothetical protein